MVTVKYDNETAARRARVREYVKLTRELDRERTMPEATYAARLLAVQTFAARWTT